MSELLANILYCKTEMNFNFELELDVILEKNYSIRIPN